MKSTLQSFLVFLRNLVSFFRKRWAQSTGRLRYILTFLRSRSLSRHPKERDKLLRSKKPRPANPSPTTVICASRLPPPLTPIIGGDTPVIASPTQFRDTPSPELDAEFQPTPTTFSFEVRQPTMLTSENSLGESHENSTGHLYADGHFLGGSRPISRSPGCHDELEPIDEFPPQSREGFTSSSPVTPSRTTSKSSSRISHNPVWQYAPELRTGYRPWSRRQPSEHSSCSLSNLDGAEAAARGYLPRALSPRPPSLALSVRPPSDASSVASHVHRASRPAGRARRPSPMSNAPRRRDRSQTPTSAHQSVHGAPPDVHITEPPQSESRTTASARRGRTSVAVSFGSLPAPKLEDNLRPMLEINRYAEDKRVVVSNVINKHVCPTATTQFLHESPENWIPLVHPEGALYWVHETEPIYTDTNMCDAGLRQRIEDGIKEIGELKDCYPCPSLSEGDWELALELEEDETGKPICSYYFACPSTRCLFWLHNVDIEAALGNLRGVTEWPHIHLALQSQYWTHWEMYPHNREIPEPLLQELLGILVHAGFDCMTSSNSTAAYSEGELNKLLGYVNHLTSVGGNYGFSACIVGRLMSFFTYSRYINFYGQNGARLTNDQTIYGATQKRTYLIRSLTVFLFYAPELHLRGLESVYTDFVLCQHRWAQFITQLQDDWREFILYGTVLLNANVALLAVPSVDPGNHNRTPVQLSSYLSIITSIGSIVIGLLLLRQHRTQPTESSEEVDKYLRSRHDAALGFETLAILYSLPYSLLLWSTMAFSTAFVLETVAFSHQLWAKLSVGVVLAIVIFLISWCIWTTIEAGEDFSVFSAVHHLKDNLVGFTRGLRGKVHEPGSDVGRCEDGGGQCENGKLRRSGTLKEAFRFFRRRRGISTASTLVSADPTVSNGPCRPLNCTTEVEVGEASKKEPGSAV